MNNNELKERAKMAFVAGRLQLWREQQVPAVSLSDPTGKHDAVAIFHMESNDLLQHITLLGEFDPPLATSAVSLQKTLRENYHTIANAIKRQFDVAKLKQCGITFRGMAEACNRLAEAWEQRGAAIMEKHKAEIKSALDKRRLNLFKSFFDPAGQKKEDLTMLLRASGAIRAQDTIASESELQEILDDMHTRASQNSSEILLENLQKAPQKLREMAQAFTTLGDSYDEQALPFLKQIRPIGPSEGTGLPGQS